MTELRELDAVGQHAPSLRPARGDTATGPPGVQLATDLRVDALSAWLTSEAVVSSRGVVRSWWSPNDDGYPYPEAGGLWLTAMCGGGTALRAAPEQVDAVARWLCEEVEAHGAVGRAATHYVFDSAMVLGGLLDYAAVRGETERTAEAIRRLFAHVSVGLRRRAPVTPVPDRQGATRWSLAYGSHLLKTAIALHKAATRCGRQDALVRVHQLVDSLLMLFDGRRFVVYEGSDHSYLHGAIYALEGLAYLHGRGFADYSPVLQQGAAWLEAGQADDGSLAPFCQGATEYGAPRADSIAQAARLWALVDAERWRPNIARALAYLGRQQAPAGGVCYRAGGQHLNTWASLFALQAARWASGRAASAELV